MTLDYALTLGVLIIVAIILAMSLNLVKGYGGIMCVSHGASMGVGAYTVGIISTRSEGDVLLAVLAGALLAGAVGWLFMAAGARLGYEDFILASFAFQMAVIDLIARWTPVTGGSTGLFGIGRPTFRGEEIYGTVPIFLLVAVIGLISVGVMIYLGRSGYGITLRAIRESHRSVAAAGKSVFSKQTATFAVAAGFAGLAGGIYAMAIGIIVPADFDINRSILVIAFLLVGGLGNMTGAIIGATALMVLPEAIKHLEAIPTQYQGPGQQILYGVIIVAFVWFRPQGLFPEKPILKLKLPRPTPQVGDDVRESREVGLDAAAR